MQIIKEIELSDGATNAAISDLLKSFPAGLPPDYLSFLRMSNGGRGIGPHLFVNLCCAEGVIEATQAYREAEFMPGFVVIGSDGCGNLLGIDTRCSNPTQMGYVVCDACNLGWDAVCAQSDSLEGLWECLKRPTP